MFYLALTLALMQTPTQTVKSPATGTSNRTAQSRNVGNSTQKVGKKASTDPGFTAIGVTTMTDYITDQHLCSILTRLNVLYIVLGGSGLERWCVPKSDSMRVKTVIANDPRLKGYVGTSLKATQVKSPSAEELAEWQTMTFNQYYPQIGTSPDPSIPAQVLAIFKDVNASEQLRPLPFVRSLRYKSRKYQDVDAERVGYEVEVTAAEDATDGSRTRVLRFAVLYPSRVFFRY
jgi:hypothetical protein